MTKASVARRYASVLFELLDAAGVEPARRGLKALSETIDGSASLRHVMASPAFSADEKTAVLGELSDRLGCPAVMKRFLGQLVVKNRVGSAAAIAEALEELVARTKGAKAVTIRSAMELSPAERQRLTDRLRDLMQGEVIVTCETDSRLVSGMQVHVGSVIYDSSMRNRLETMRTLLAKE